MSTSRGSTVVAWTRATRPLPEPIVRRVPYVELKLEHPGLDATGVRDAFFPDAIPYRTPSEGRAFYWRGALPPDGPESAAWTGVCATTHGCRAIPGETGVSPALWTTTGDAGAGERVHELVVDGTVAGGSETARVGGFEAPEVVVRSIDGDAVELGVDSELVSIPSGTRRTLSLAARSCRGAGEGDGEVSVAPRLSVRYPGERTFCHPARGADYALFPSFGVDLDALDRRVAVPTTCGELDHEALAAVLGVDLAERPYPERVLWQAFAYTAFDPHRDDDVRLARSGCGLLQVANPVGPN